jgi:hypothetical protein
MSGLACCKFSCQYFFHLLFGNKTHLVPPVLVGVEELQQLWAPEQVHDLYLPLHVAPVFAGGALDKLGRERLARLELNAFHHHAKLAPEEEDEE